MRMQCAATAAAAVGSVSGIRARVRAHGRRWATPRRMRALTAGATTVATATAPMLQASGPARPARSGALESRGDELGVTSQHVLVRPGGTG
jgi:hypothetical protein